VKQLPKGQEVRDKHSADHHAGSGDLERHSDPRLQQFVDKFRASQQYTPEYGGECAGGLGTPLQQ
jgi:hypothetical protein